jgi:hypothetical protein
MGTGDGGMMRDMETAMGKNDLRLYQFHNGTLGDFQPAAVERYEITQLKMSLVEQFVVPPKARPRVLLRDESDSVGPLRTEYRVEHGRKHVEVLRSKQYELEPIVDGGASANYGRTASARIEIDAHEAG